MDYNCFEKELLEKLELINIKLNEKQVQEFYNYMNLLISWNEKINLTAIIDPKEIIVKHFMDSLVVKKHLRPKDIVADIGTGAGFPGVPLKIVCKENKFVLIDSLNKRINFLNEVIRENQLNLIDAVHSRAEDIGHDKNYREKFDIVLSRAVAKLNVLAEYMLPLVKVNGKCICLKGPNIKEEIEEAKNAINILGGKITNIEEYKLPGTDIERTLIEITLEKPMPSKYPRKAGMPNSKNWHYFFYKFIDFFFKKLYYCYTV